jgi:hypothetical protein
MKSNLLVAHDRLELGGRRVGVVREIRREEELMHADVPDPPFLLHLPEEREVPRFVDCCGGRHQYQINLGYLELRELLLERRFRVRGIGLRRRGTRLRRAASWPGASCRRSCLNPELVDNRADAVLDSRATVQHVDDFAAVVEQRLEDILVRGGIYWRPWREADDREHLTRRWDGSLHELAGGLFKCAEQV